MGFAPAAGPTLRLSGLFAARPYRLRMRFAMPGPTRRGGAQRNPSMASGDGVRQRGHAATIRRVAISEAHGAVHRKRPMRYTSLRLLRPTSFDTDSFVVHLLAEVFSSPKGIRCLQYLCGAQMRR